MRFLYLFFLFFAITNFSNPSYLVNKEADVEFIDIPTGGAFPEGYSFPYQGFGCSVKYLNNIYFISSSHYPSYWIRNADSYKCNKVTKKVEVMKFNTKTGNFSNSLLQTNTGDNIVTCGVDKSLNLLYYISGNYYNCPSNYNLDSSITRINLTNFNFIDKTLLKDISGIPKFSESSYWEYKYIHSPTTSIHIDGNSLLIGFGGHYTGIWRLNITSTPIQLIDSLQRTYYGIDEYMSLFNDDSNQKIKYRFQHIKMSFTLNNNIYFVDDSGYRDVNLLRVNSSYLTKEPLIKLNENNTDLIVLDGISYISDIEIDYFRKKIYIVTGVLNSEMYIYNFNFEKIPIKANCNIDFLKFPTEWGVISNIILDKNTQYLYAILSTKYNYVGIVKINTKDMIIGDNILRFIEYRNYTYIDYYTKQVKTQQYAVHFINLNISTLLDNEGILYLAPSTNYNHKKIAKINLFGCSEGFGFNNKSLLSTCELCIPGKYSNSIGSICTDCFAGYSSNQYESVLCDKCIAGKFSSNMNNINCKNCPAGKYAELAGSSNCTNCTQGRYSIIAASKTKDNCIECEKGDISQSGQTSCKSCLIGKWANNKIQCMECSTGKFSNRLGLDSDNECIDCPIGKYNNELGLISEGHCKICPHGKVGIISGAKKNNSCIRCEDGKFKQTNSYCEMCPSGWVSNAVRDFCIICPIGKIADIYGLQCVLCPIGLYNDLTGLSLKFDTCKQCNAGKFSNEIGLKSILRCKECPKGKYSEELGIISESFCINCPEGKYNMLNGQSNPLSCLECSSGKWNKNLGANSSNFCIACDPGYFSEIEAGTSKEVCIECSIGKYGIKVGANSENDCVSCPTGTFSSIGSTNCKLCEVGKYSSYEGSSSCGSCEEGKYAPKKGSFICLDCPSNSEQNYERTSCVCSMGSYQSNNNSDSIQCLNCEEQFICDKNTNINTLKLKPHFWRESKFTTYTYKCKNIYACKGGLILNTSDSVCQPGHRGPLCDICKKGWAKDDGICLQCPEDNSRSISLTIFIPVICIILIIFLIKTANPSHSKKEEVNGLLKIFMNYAQVFSLASSFQINWPILIKYLFERAKEFSSPRISFYSSDCTIGWSYYQKLSVYLLLPLVYMFLVTIFIAIISLCYCKRKKKKIKKMSSQIEIKEYIERKPSCKTFFIAWEKTAIVVGTFLSWPTIVEKTLEVMNCEKIGNGYYLVKDFSVICYDTTHYNFLIISYIAIIIYGIGIPLFGFYLLYSNKYRLFDMNNRYNSSTPLSFLFLGYRENRWFYEFIIMGKKAGLIILSVFLRNHPRYQIICASLLIQISFFLHVFLKPYDTITNYGMICNKLESISLLSLVMTLSTGLFFGTIDSGYELGTFEDVLIIILLLSNGGIVLYFFVYFIILGKKSILSFVRERSKNKYKKNKIPWWIYLCNTKNRQLFKEWVYKQETDDYGIKLKTDMEKEIFSNYFKEKKSKLEILNDKIDALPKKRLSIKLDKLRSEIHVMEKERCWQTIKNNRLYSKLKKLAMINKIDCSDEEIDDLNDIFKLWVKQGVKYNDKMNHLYMDELKGMIPDSPMNKGVELTNTILYTEEQLEAIKGTKDDTHSIII